MAGKYFIINYINRSLEEGMKIINLFWLFSLVLIEICTIIPIGADFLSMELPEFIIRGIGIIDLAALLVLAYTTVKKLKGKK